MNSIDKQIDTIMENCGMLESKYPEYRDKIKQLIVAEKLEAFDIAFDSHDYDGLREYRASLIAQLKGESKDE